jgi:predicted small lipoprotein YifL
MKRFFASVLVMSILSIGLAGCGEKSKTKTTTEKSTPGGSTTTTQETTTKKTGDNKTNP